MFHEARALVHVGLVEELVADPGVSVLKHLLRLDHLVDQERVALLFILGSRVLLPLILDLFARNLKIFNIVLNEVFWAIETHRLARLSNLKAIFIAFIQVLLRSCIELWLIHLRYLSDHRAHP